MAADSVEAARMQLAALDEQRHALKQRLGELEAREAAKRKADDVEEATKRRRESDERTKKQKQTAAAGAAPRAAAARSADREDAPKLPPVERQSRRSAKRDREDRVEQKRLAQERLEEDEKSRWGRESASQAEKARGRRDEGPGLLGAPAARDGDALLVRWDNFRDGSVRGGYYRCIVSTWAATGERYVHGRDRHAGWWDEPVSFYPDEDDWKHDPAAQDDDAEPPAAKKQRQATRRWTDDETQRLKDGVEAHGVGSWGVIRKDFGFLASGDYEGRTTALMKAKWQKLEKAKLPKVAREYRRWTDDETRRLVEGVAAHGVGSWGAIRKNFGFLASGDDEGRTGDDLYSKWQRLDQREVRRLAPWTDDETRRLVEGVAEHGVGSWRKIQAECGFMKSGGYGGRLIPALKSQWWSLRLRSTLRAKAEEEKEKAKEKGKETKKKRSGKETRRDMTEDEWEQRKAAELMRLSAEREAVLADYDDDITTLFFECEADSCENDGSSLPYYDFCWRVGEARVEMMRVAAMKYQEAIALGRDGEAERAAVDALRRKSCTLCSQRQVEKTTKARDVGKAVYKATTNELFLNTHCVGPWCKNDVTGKTWFFDAVGMRALSPDHEDEGKMPAFSNLRGGGSTPGVARDGGVELLRREHAPAARDLAEDAAEGQRREARSLLGVVAVLDGERARAQQLRVVEVAFARAPHAAMASDDAKEKMRLQLSLREIYAKSTLYYYGTNHSPATPQQQRPTPTTPSTAPAAAPTRRWELAELEPASPPPAKRARPEPAPAPAPAADEPELLFSPPFKFATTAGSYETQLGVEANADAEAITTVEFDGDGGLVALGDRGGRVAIFERDESSRLPRYAPLCEFKSHDPEFDYLKSLEVEEKINQIRFCRGLGRRSCRLLSANDKTIKLWKVHERRVDGVGDLNGPGFRGRGGRLRVPRVVPRGRAMAATPARCYANAHAYHINSVSVNSDGEHFASADDLRINLWNLEVDDRAFNVVDLKPANMEDLTEVITSAAFHPVDCAVLLYASSKGTMKLFDLRDGARCDRHRVAFDDGPADDAATKSFFSEIVSSISDARFSPDGRFVVSRDFLSVKVWDCRSDRAPLKTILVHEHLRPRLCDLYESDCIFDKFEVAAGRDADAVVTGSYGDAAHVFDGAGRSVEIDLDLASLTRTRRSARRCAPTRAARSARRPAEPAQRLATTPLGRVARRRRRPEPDAAGACRAKPPRPAHDAVDFRKRVLHVASHPTEPTFLVAGLDRAYLFHLHQGPGSSAASDDTAGNA
ncbi:RNA polymerase II transcription regulator recruiting protein [Aureococcus anophagefferens]|nr:RNA polymerase II transcription regulator recruiting protein [Aureococcus anophagefferens]